MNSIDLKDRARAERDGSIDSTLINSADPFAPREGKTLTWRHVNMKLAASGKHKERILLDNVWGEGPPRETTAIMGASGAGTILMTVLVHD